MMTGFLEGHQANGAFVAVGPPGKYYLRRSRETPMLTARLRFYGTRSPETWRIRSGNVRYHSVYGFPPLWRSLDVCLPL